MARPSWYRTARVLGGVPWVPMEVAAALQEQVDQSRQQLIWAEGELRAAREALDRATRDRGQAQALEEERLRTRQLAQLVRETETRLEAAVGEAQVCRAQAEEAERMAQELAEQLARRDHSFDGPDDRLKRLAADLENVRRHAADEAERARKAERIQRLDGLGDVLDALREALETSPEPNSPWHQGVLVLMDKVRSELRRAGAHTVGEMGEVFDPQVHEAVASAPSSDVPEDRILQVFQVGISLDDGALVRAARVVVSTGATSSAEPAES